jgi:hypothetical protein
MIRTPCALLFLCSTSVAFAADMDVSELRVGAGVLPKHFSGGGGESVSENGSSVTTTSYADPGSSEARSNYRLEVQYMRGDLGPVGGFLYGLDAAINRARFTVPNAVAAYTTPVLDLQLGYGFAPTSNWDIELTAFGGFGWTYYHISSSNSSSVSSDGHYVEYGARLATYVEVTDRCEVGIEIPYLVGAFHPHYSSNNNNGTTVNVSDSERNRGFAALVQVGFRL